MTLKITQIYTFPSLLYPLTKQAVVWTDSALFFTFSMTSLRSRNYIRGKLIEQLFLSHCDGYYVKWKSMKYRPYLRGVCASQSVFLGPPTVVSTGSMTEGLGPQKLWGRGPAVCFNKFFRWFWCKLKFETFVLGA